jgi:hypothetical protein
MAGDAAFLCPFQYRALFDPQMLGGFLRCKPFHGFNPSRMPPRHPKNAYDCAIRGEDLFPLLEAFEVFEILSAFEEQSSVQLGATVKRALSGPLQPIKETDASRDGRNTWFELALAAEWKLRGASVEIAEPDLRLYVERQVFFVACKRPARISSVHANIRDAIGQLNEALTGAPDGHYGVIAISMSKCLNAGDKFWSGSLQALGDRLQGDVAAFEKSWKAANSNPRISAILFHVATPDIGRPGVDICRATYSIASEVNRTTGTEVFKKFAIQMSQDRLKNGEGSE